MLVNTIVNTLATYMTSTGNKLSKEDISFLLQAVSEGRAGDFGTIVAELEKADMASVRKSLSRLSAAASALIVAHRLNEATNPPPVGSSALVETTHTANPDSSRPFNQVAYSDEIGTYCDDGVSVEAAQALYRQHHQTNDGSIHDTLGGFCDDEQSGNSSDNISAKADDEDTDTEVIEDDSSEDDSTSGIDIAPVFDESGLDISSQARLNSPSGAVICDDSGISLSSPSDHGISLEDGCELIDLNNGDFDIDQQESAHSKRSEWRAESDNTLSPFVPTFVTIISLLALILIAIWMLWKK